MDGIRPIATELIMGGNAAMSLADSDRLPVIAQWVYIWNLTNPSEPATRCLGWTGDCQESNGSLLYRLESFQEGGFQEPIWRSLDQIFLADPMATLREIRTAKEIYPQTTYVEVVVDEASALPLSVQSTISLSLNTLLQRIRCLTPQEQGAIAIDCIMAALELEQAIAINYSGVLSSRSSDDLIQILETELDQLQPEQLRLLAAEILSRL